MKTCILGLCLLGLTNLIQAQNELAMATTNLNGTTYNSSKVSHNSQYLKHITVKPMAVRVMKLQHIAANYDITSQPIYNPTDKNMTYTVVFEEKESQINAVYDYKGKIISCEEYYTNVRMPYHLSTQLAKEYPGWSFNTINYAIKYSSNDEAIATYKVKLIKDNRSKTVTIKP